MSGNTFGKILRLTTFGESHGKAVGGILDGFPAGIKIDEHLLQLELKRRKPGQNELVSSRNEADEVEILSGVFNSLSLGTPIAFLVWNKDQNPADYVHLEDAFRPSHADFTFEKKYGIRDYRGGGRSSARETIARVIGGAFAKMILNSLDIRISAFVNRIGEVALQKDDSILDLSLTENSPVRCPDAETSDRMIELIGKMKKEGDTLGGEIKCIIQNVPVSWGEPVFDKLHADLGKAMLSINAVKGFAIGSGFEAAKMRGSVHNDLFEMQGGKVRTQSNFSGGVQGGISNGEDIYFNVAFKPVATLMKDQQSIDKFGKAITLKGKGRHDVCVVPRAVPIVEAMAALVLADHFLLNKTVHL
ncbi:MAG: chorismate synthase [Bacteroidetes bacterium]|nr:MAG: chorismate synthase [Bacteroidota bacterium]